MKRVLSILAILTFAAAAYAGVTVLDDKQPWESLRGTVSFASRLSQGGDNVCVDNVCTITGADNVATCTVFARDSGGVDVDNQVLTWDNTMISGQTVGYTYWGGRDGRTYTITFRCTSDNGVQLEQDVVFTVREY